MKKLLIANPEIKINNRTYKNTKLFGVHQETIQNNECEGRYAISSKSVRIKTWKLLCRRQKLWHLWANTTRVLRLYWTIRVYRAGVTFPVPWLWFMMLIKFQSICSTIRRVLPRQNKERDSTRLTILYGNGCASLIVWFWNLGSGEKASDRHRR